MIVRRPSPWRVLPVLMLCLGAVVVALANVSPAVSLLCVMACVPAAYLIVELATHCVVIDQRSVTDRRLHQVSTTFGVQHPFAVRGSGRAPRPPRGSGRIQWTESDGNVHAVSFVWFSRRAADDIVEGVRALQR